MKSLKRHFPDMKQGFISRRHFEERGGNKAIAMAKLAKSGYVEEPIGQIRENGMRYAGRLPDGTEVIHTPIDFKGDSTRVSFNVVAKMLESMGTHTTANQFQLAVIRDSYSPEERTQIWGCLVTSTWGLWGRCSLFLRRCRGTRILDVPG